jgi:phage tail-like protein
MSCPPDPATFRLLDALVGWDVDKAKGLVGFDDLAGVTLEPSASALTEEAIAVALPPARLAPGCGPCEWYLVTCCPPASRLLRLDACAPGWRPLWRGHCDPHMLVCATAVAVHCDRIAVSDPGAGRIWFWRKGGAELDFSVAMAQPGPLAWAGWGEWLVADLKAMRLRRLDPGGARRGRGLPLPGTADRLRVDSRNRIWLATHDQGLYRLWMAKRGAPAFLPTTLKALLEAFADTGLRRAGGHHFCIEDIANGARRLRCFDCYGRPATPPPAPPAPPAFGPRGQLLTAAIDSGIPRCRWHRVRLDALVPAGTALAIAVSTNEEAAPPPQGPPAIPDGEWAGFAGGVPHPDDWHEAPLGALDFVIDQPPGRYLFVRLRLTGDGLQTPIVRRIRLDFPRQTSFDRLPAVYHDNPVAVNFGERFLSLFDAAIEDIDQVVERYPALLDVDGVPQELLPWLGTFLGVAMDAAWSPEQRRAILKAIPDLYRRRGTPGGFSRALELVLGAKPAISETALSRPWGAVGASRLEAVRLFGRSAVRLRAGRSRLDTTPVWSIGNPDHDPLSGSSFRFQVMLPMAADAGMRAQAARVVESQKPAHTVATLRHGAAGLVVGMGTGIGIDTALVPLPRPVLGGADGVRLSRSSVLWSRYHCAESNMRVGAASAVGIHTLVE